MASETKEEGEVDVVALVENLELAKSLPERLLLPPPPPPPPSPLIQYQPQQRQQSRVPEAHDTDDSEISPSQQFSLALELKRKLDDESVAAPPKPTEHRLPPDGIAKQLLQRFEAIEKSPKKINGGDAPKKRNRNKNKSLEVRRNPLRTVVARKELQPSRSSREARASSSRQRLLAARRLCNDSESTADPATTTVKRSRSSTSTTTTVTSTSTATNAGYMSTRSVTRKQGSVGANYEAPTWRDQAEWKHWPAHGMHERPVYHPQFGLATEYNGRIFASFDGESYREISSGNGGGSETQIEIVRVDPRAESLDRREAEEEAAESARTAAASFTAKRSICNSGIVRYLRQRSATALGPTAPAARAIVRLGVDKTAATRIAAPTNTTVAYNGRTFDRLQLLSRSLGLVHRQQQQQQIRDLERLQQLESLQRLSSRLRAHQSSDNSQVTKYPIAATTTVNSNVAGRVLAKEVFRSLGQARKAGLQPSPSKCLILPRANHASQPVAAATTTVAATAPVSLPFCEVQAVKSNSQGKLFFVKAPDTPKKLVTERTSTITSSSQSSSVSWAEVSLRKRPDGTSTLLVDVPRTFASNQRPAPAAERPRQPPMPSRGYPPIRLAETTSIFRAKVAMPREDPGLSTAKSSTTSGVRNFESRAVATANEDVDDQQAEVLDLSIKQQDSEPMEMDLSAKTNKNKASESVGTDLVQYFKNFGADESIDSMEDPKNLT